MISILSFTEIVSVFIVSRLQLLNPECNKIEMRGCCLNSFSNCFRILIRGEEVTFLSLQILILCSQGPWPVKNDNDNVSNV